jgi:hypothetical protein
MMLELGEPLSDDEAREVIDEIASVIVKRRLETPAVLFLEMNKPLSTIAGQGMIVAMPFLGTIFGPTRMARYSRFLQTRENVERLIQRIEEMTEEK